MSVSLSKGSIESLLGPGWLGSHQQSQLSSTASSQLAEDCRRSSSRGRKDTRGILIDNAGAGGQGPFKQQPLSIHIFKPLNDGQAMDFSIFQTRLSGMHVPATWS